MRRQDEDVFTIAPEIIRPGKFVFQEEDQLSDDITVGDLSLEDIQNDEAAAEDSEDTSSEPSEESSEPSEESSENSSDESSEEENTESESSESPDDVPEYLKGRLSDDDLKAIESSETEDMDPNSVELGTIGSDESSEQNEYDPKDVETLMKLMASEADAMAEYLDAAKETNTDVLRRLYADIGNEERFHMEQLLYAKCELTGEKYEPKDPEVKSEYEELLAMGMDEETAMQTAVDRLHIRGTVELDTQDVAEMASEISDDIAILEQNLALFNINLANVQNADHAELQQAYETFAEVCLITESVHYKDSDDRGIDLSRNPIRLLLDAFGFLLRTLLKIVKKIKEFFSMVRNKHYDMRAFIKRYGWGRIFDSGIHLYFDPTVDNGGRPTIPKVIYQWAVLAMDTMELAYNELNIPLPENSSNTSFRNSNRAATLVTRGNISHATGMLNQLHLTKTKVLLPTDKNEQEVLITYLLGFTTTTKYGTHGESENIVNDYTQAISIWNIIIKSAEKALQEMAKMENDANSVKHKNPKGYNRAFDAFNTIMKSAQAFAKAITSDVNTMIKLNKTVYNDMVHQDQERNPRAHEVPDETPKNEQK